MEEVAFIKIGFGNIMAANKIIAILDPHSAPVKRSIHNARAQELVIDVTCNRKTRSVILTDSGHIVLSSLQRERQEDGQKSWQEDGR